jgi:TolA-binding protein
MTKQLSNEDRIAALEHRVSTLEQRYDKDLELYRRIQIDDEKAITYLQNQLRKLQNVVQSLLKKPLP